MTIKPHTLCVTKTDQDVDDHQSTFVLDEEKRSIDESRLDALFFELRHADIDDRSEIPLYDLLSKQLWTNTRMRFGQEPRKMHILILLYKRLEKRVDDQNIEQIVCDDVCENYRLLVRDLCDEKNITFVDNSKTGVLSSYYETLRVILKSFSSIALLFVDQFFSLLFGRFLTSETDSDLAVMFPVVRPKTFAPIYRKFDMKFDTVYTLRTLGYIFKYRNIVPDSANIRLIQRNITVDIIISELKILLSIYYHVLYSNSQSTTIADWIRNRENVSIDRLIQRLYTRTALLNLDTVFVYIIASRFFEQNDYEKLLVPGTARTSRGLSYAASGQGVDIYHLNHGIGARSLVAEKLEQTHFTPGELNKRYIENSQNKNIRPVPTGLPKHQTILQKHSELRTELSTDTSSTVVLATQPYLDKIRSEFIDDVVDVLLTHTEYEIIIKPHPGEDTGYYDALIELKYDETDRRRITVDKGELYKKLYLADLTITISSNVGIESVILETPAITYNTWTPDIATPLYVEYGPIPKCESPTGLRSLLQDTDPTDLIQDQKEILDTEYIVHGNSVEQITGKIQTEIVD